MYLLEICSLNNEDSRVIDLQITKDIVLGGNYMAKEDVASIFVYLAMLAIALLVGFLVINPALANITLSMNKFLFALIAILCGLLFNVILAELAHIVGAKIGKYKITSV